MLFASIQSPSVPLFPNVLSKFMALGFSLDDVIVKATTEPAKIIGRVPGFDPRRATARLPLPQPVHVQLARRGA